MDGNEPSQIIFDASRVVISEFYFGVDPDEKNPDIRSAQLRDAAIVRGVMWTAAVTLVDGLLRDVALVHAQPEGLWADVMPETEVLGLLPNRFWHRMTPGLANRFTVAAVELTGRVSRGWSPPDCVAHELVLKGLLDEMEDVAQSYEVRMPEQWRAALEDSLFEDLDHDYLFAPEYDGFENDPKFGPGGMTPMDIDNWFAPFRPESRLTPFLED